MHHKELSELAHILRNDGDQILNSTSKLSLSASLLAKLNESFSYILNNDVFSFTSQFQIFASSNSFLDLQLIFDFIQKTLALKLFPDYCIFNDDFLDLKLFSSLKFLEVQRLSLNVLRGLKHLRSQLEYVTCIRSLDNVSDVLEVCGADKTQGYVWPHLKEAVFTHNQLKNIDTSLEFAPSLQSLDLSHNLLKNIESLTSLSNLRHLNLSNNKLESLPAFDGLQSLTVLILKNNFLCDIRELSRLSNLQKLDVSSNCLVSFDSVKSLSVMEELSWLSLIGNPITYALNYRIELCKYLHESVTDFTLDNIKLKNKELRYVGSVRIDNFFRAESNNSIITACTVVQMPFDKNVNQTSDMEISSDSFEVDVNRLSNTVVHRNFVTLMTQENAMQDSGFDGFRPSSPSESIGSATSLQDGDNFKIYESDIEILSNPSQSSIEVLSSSRSSLMMDKLHPSL